MFKNFKIRTALKFGKLEHMFAKILGIYLFVICLIKYFSNQSYYIELIALILWIVYHISHRLEKFFYGKGLRK
jgi:hypothetical protein